MCLIRSDCRSGRLHLRSIANGEPHSLASHEWIDHGLNSHAATMVFVSDHTLAARIRDRLVVWNWRTGTKVLVSVVSSKPPLILNTDIPN
jgi:hypothetical protein